MYMYVCTYIPYMKYIAKEILKFYDDLNLRCLRKMSRALPKCLPVIWFPLLGFSSGERLGKRWGKFRKCNDSCWLSSGYS